MNVEPPERVAARRARPARDQRPHALGRSAVRLLLQDADQAALGCGRKVEPLIRKVAGRGRVDLSDRPARPRARLPPSRRARARPRARRASPAALGAAEAGARVRRRRGRARLEARRRRDPSRTPSRDCSREVEARAADRAAARRTRAFGIYEGPEVPLIGPDLLSWCSRRRSSSRPARSSRWRSFPGNDVPGVFLGRGAVRLAAQHGIKAGDVAVRARRHARGAASTSRRCSARHEHRGRRPPGRRDERPGFRRACARSCADGPARTARSASAPSACATPAAPRRSLRPARLSAASRRRRTCCARARRCPCWAAGDLSRPAPVEQVVARRARGRRARRPAASGVELPELGQKRTRCGADGYVCICYDVTVGRSSAGRPRASARPSCSSATRRSTMGACQGRLCHGQLRELAERLSPGGDPRLGGPTTARPPARAAPPRGGRRGRPPPPRAAHGAARRAPRASARRFLWAGQWKRVEHYGYRRARDAIHREYRAVREGVGIIDVGTLGKFLVTGPDVVAFLERLYPNRVGDLQPGRLRYGLLLDEGGVIHDDGTICRIDERDLLPHGHDLGRRGGRGADDRLARRLGPRRAHRQPDLGARRDQRRRPEGARGARDADRGRHLEGGASPTSATARSPSPASRAWRSASASSARSAGSCTTPPRAPRSCGGAARGRRGARHQPFGIQAQRLLRLEKGHIIVSQDTDFETTPWHLGMDWAVKLDKDDFVGKRRARAQAGHGDREARRLPARRRRRGALGGRGRQGRRPARRPRDVLAGTRRTLGYGIGLALGAAGARRRGTAAEIGTRTRARASVQGAFYDPEGAKLRA